jgi:hypothetical protein
MVGRIGQLTGLGPFPEQIWLQASYDKVSVMTTLGGGILGGSQPWSTPQLAYCMAPRTFSLPLTVLNSYFRKNQLFKLVLTLIFFLLFYRFVLLYLYYFSLSLSLSLCVCVFVCVWFVLLSSYLRWRLNLLAVLPLFYYIFKAVYLRLTYLRLQICFSEELQVLSTFSYVLILPIFIII